MNNHESSSHYSFHSARMHPEYKKVQEDLVNLNRQYLEMEHNYNRNVTQLQD